MHSAAAPRPWPAAPAVIRVALVEDDEVFRQAFVEGVQAAPDLVVHALASTRAQALQMLRGPAAAVLLVDLALPDGTGIDVIREAQRWWPACPSMVSTVFGDEAHVLASIEAGASGYLLKDCTPSAMVQEIRALHEGGSPISPRIARSVLSRLRMAALPPEAQREATLSARETQVLELVAKGYAYDEIAQRLEVSRHTVQTFVRRTYIKLKVNSKMGAVNEARRQGLLPR